MKHPLEQKMIKRRIDIKPDEGKHLRERAHRHGNA